MSLFRALSSRSHLTWLGLAAAGAFVLTCNNRAFPITMGDPVSVEGGFGLAWLAGLLLGRWAIAAVAVGAAASGWWDGVGVGLTLVTVAVLAAEAAVGWLVLRSGPWRHGLNQLEQVVVVVFSASVAAAARGAIVAAGAAALGVPDPLWQGVVAAGVGWFANLLAAAVGVPWRGAWRVPLTAPRIVELAALVLLTVASAHVVFGGTRPFGLNLPIPVVAWLAVLHAWTVLRFHAHGLALVLIGWFLVFDLHATARGTFDPAIPLTQPPIFQLLLFVAMAVLLAVELAVAAVAAQRVAEAADNARLAAELRARNAELEVGVAATAREHAFLDAVLAQMPAGVMIVAPDGTILRRNERHERLWRLQSPPTQLDQLGSGTFTLSGNRRLPFDNWPIVRALLHGETTEAFEARLSHPYHPGEAADVSIGAGPVFAADGGILGAVAVMTDVTERKAISASLRENEQRLRIALQSARMLPYEWETASLAFHTAESLARWCDLTGIPEPATVAGLLAMIHPDDVEGVRRAVDQMAAGGTTCETEFRVPRADGTVVRVMSRSSRLTDIDGRLTDRVVGIFIDVTDRQRNEDRLRLLESAVVHARDAVVILESEPESGPGRSVLYANAAFGRMTGYAADEVVGRSLHFLRGPNSDPATLERLRDALNLGLAFQGELLNYRKDGAEYWVELSVVPVPDRGGRCAHFVMIQRDVSDRRRAEDELRRSEQMLADAQRVAHIGSWEYDPAARHLRWSAEEYRIFGRDSATFTVVPEAVEGCIHPDDWPGVTELFAEVLRHPAAHSFDYRAVRPGGELRYVRDQVQPVTDADGRLLRLYGVTHDVTESRQAQEQLAQAQKMELIGQLAGGIAHDFNNILTGIIGNLARVELPADDRNRPLVGVALTAAGRAADLTRKLLGFARRHQLLLAPVRPAEFVEEVVGLISSTFDPRIRVVTDLDADAEVSADGTLMSQVLLNLCVNAKDAMPAGGTLTLRVAATDVADPPAECHAGPHVRMTVEDTGEGIPPDVMARLFEPFFTTKPVGQGTGLGLAMVHGIMRQHDGWVECRSEVGVGTRFDLYLPRRSDGPQVRLAPAVSWSVAAAPLSATPPPSDRSITILIVDDEEMIRSLGRAVLESAGYRVLEASDGEDAVELFRVAHADIDLVILDLTMPRMSGQDAFRELAAADPGVRVLLSSGYTPDGLADTVGILGLLPKPYRPAELLDAVRVALNLSPTPEWAAANH